MRFTIYSYYKTHGICEEASTISRLQELNCPGTANSKHVTVLLAYVSERSTLVAILPKLICLIMKGIYFTMFFQVSTGINEFYIIQVFNETIYYFSSQVDIF